MKSHCLTHQDREAAFRCGTCSKPLCEECARQSPEGVYCSEQCRLNAIRSGERFADFRAKDAAARAAAQRAALVRNLVMLAILGALVVGGIMAWPYVPAGVKKPVTNFFQGIGK